MMGVMSNAPRVGTTRRSGARTGSLWRKLQLIHFEYGEIGSQELAPSVRAFIAKLSEP